MRRRTHKVVGWFVRRLRWCGVWLFAAPLMGGCGGSFLESAKPVVGAIDAGAQALCAQFVRTHAPKIEVPDEVTDAVAWYCSDPVILDIFRDQYARKMNRLASDTE